MVNAAESHHSRQHTTNKPSFAKHFKSIECNHFSEAESSRDIAHVLWNVRGPHGFHTLLTDILNEIDPRWRGMAWWHFLTPRETDSGTCERCSGEGGKVWFIVSDARHVQSEFHPCHGYVVSDAQQQRYLYLFSLIKENCIKGNVFPGLYAILKHYPSILFTLGSTTDYSDNAETLPRGKISKRWWRWSLPAITFLNTSTVIGVKPLCTSVALMDNCFRRFAEVEVREAWSRGNQTWTAIGNIDT